VDGASPPYTTFGKSGHLAPHWSFKFRACFRTVGRDLVALVEQLGVDTVALDQSMEVIPTPTATLVTFDVEHIELVGQVAEYDRAFMGHDSASRSPRDSGAAAMSSHLSCVAIAVCHPDFSSRPAWTVAIRRPANPSTIRPTMAGMYQSGHPGAAADQHRLSRMR
jgi:hypothetical protein